jgi:hypothetical protein
MNALLTDVTLEDFKDCWIPIPTKAYSRGVDHPKVYGDTAKDVS